MSKELDMGTELLEIVKKQLPEMQVSAIANLIAEHKKFKTETENLTQKLKDSDKNLEDARKLLRDAQAKESKVQDILSREGALKVAEAELKLNLALLARDQAHSVQRVEDHKSMVALVFNNPKLKYTEYGSQPVFVPHHKNQYGILEPDGFVEPHTTTKNVEVGQ